MNKHFSTSFFFLMLLVFSLDVSAQITKEDYARADSVMKLANLVYNQVAEVNWIDSTSTLWYATRTKNGIEYTFIDAEKKTKQSAFDTGRLVEALNKQLGKKVTKESLRLRDLKPGTVKNSLHFSYDNAFWTFNTKNFLLQKDSVMKPRERRGYWGGGSFDELNNDPVPSPDSAWTAFIKDYNVYVKDKAGKEQQLSFDGSPGDYYSSYFSWSPDSKKLAVNKVRKNEPREIFFVESSPDSQLQPILHKRNYLKPGDALPIKHPSLFDIENMKQIPVDSKVFEYQYSLSNPNWDKNNSAFTFEFNQRGHQVYQVVKVDAETGDTKVIIDETSKTFIDYSGKRFRHDLEQSNEIIWASERDGWNHLYLFDANSGELKNQITKGDWMVREVLHVDEENHIIYFYGSGKNEGEDPYFKHCYKVNFDGSGLVDLTPEKMEHEVTFSKNFEYFTDTYSTVQEPPVIVLRSAADGQVILDMEKADITDLLAKGWIAPEPFVAKGRDGKTDIWGNIYRPTNFDANKSYPVIEYIYAGPQSSFTQKNFRPVSYTFSGLAELGFIIVQMDGMGTSNRSKAFHDVCWKDLKDAGFPDRILWMKAAAQKYKYMDISRVGIFGGSAGGQNALGGLLFHPEFYKAGVASCGCHDNRMDKMWWNEQWMGYPIGPQYAECSNVVNANKLEGNLMLIVGEVDDNVDPASTMQVADALIKAKKDFELVVLPGVNHTLGGTYGEQKRRDFFIQTLLHKETPDWNTVSND